MKKTILIMSVLLLSSCNKKDPASECKDLSMQFDSATRGYLVGCMKSCFRSTIAYAKEPDQKEKFKDSCESLCRDTIPYEQINQFKEAIDLSYSCGFDYSKKLANPPKKDEIKD